MARIAGVSLPPKKRIVIGLTYVYGIGPMTAAKILDEVKVSHDIRVKDLSQEDEALIRDYIGKNYRVEGDLQRDVLSDIKRLREIKSYRGSRHEKKLPARGQRSKTNARTKRGKKQTMGSGRKKAAAKT